jgi:hypothetical protein
VDQQELQFMPWPFFIFLAWMTCQTYTGRILPAEADPNDAALGSGSGNEPVLLPSDVHSFNIQFYDAFERTARDVVLQANVMDYWGEPDPLTHRTMREIEAQITQNCSDIVPLFPVMADLVHLGFIEPEKFSSDKIDSDEMESIITPGALQLINAENNALTTVVSGQSSSDATPELVLVPGTSLSRPRGRPRKTETPKVESLVRRCTRNNNEGYIHEALPNHTSRRKAKVPKAMTPEVLQISEMQRLGVEECHIDPEELTEERLYAARKA